jgi:hypothetical protein
VQRTTFNLRTYLPGFASDAKYDYALLSNGIKIWGQSYNLKVKINNYVGLRVFVEKRYHSI